MSLKLPDGLVSAASVDRTDVSDEAAIGAALEIFWEGAVSLGRAAELCETPPVAFMDSAVTQGVPPLNYGIKQLEEDRRILARLRS